VPALPAGVRGRSRTAGGILGYPLEQLYEEVAYIAYHFHWSHERLMELEHAERRRWVREVGKINRRVNEGSG
jgi:hypothetical protein